jgi:hypothetical protein
VAVAVGGPGLGSVAGRVAVLVGSRVAVLGGGRGVSVGEGTGCASVGAVVAVGVGGLGVAGASVGEADGDGVGVALGWSVGVGCGVLVGRAGTSRVLVGVAVIAGLPGEHWIITSPTRPVPTRKNQNHRSLLIAKCRIAWGFTSSFRPTTLILENRIGYKRFERTRVNFARYMFRDPPLQAAHTTSRNRRHSPVEGFALTTRIVL